jgi:hypothetical protein
MENEDEKTVGKIAETTTATDEPAKDNKIAEEQVNVPNLNVDKSETLAEKTFAQSQVNEIVRERINGLYSHYGAKGKKELDEMVGKSQSFDVMKEKYEGIISENSNLKERLEFLNNNIEPAKYDDVKAYFKGKELEFNDENLKKELATHPEWVIKKVASGVSTTTITPLGNEKHDNKPENEEEKMSRIFGIH